MTNEPWGPLPQPDYAFYRSPASGLFLPLGHSPGHGQQTSDLTPDVMDNFQVPVSWSDLHGSAPTYDDVVARLRPYGLEMVLATLGAISWRISMPGDHDTIKPQRELISRVFDDPGQLGNDIEAWRTTTADSESGALPIVFRELQLVTAAKIALLEVPPASANGPSTLQAFGEALLMVNDLIGVHTRSHELPQGIRERADLLRWVRYVVPNRLFHGGGNVKHAIARAHDLYLTDRQHLRSKAGYVDLLALFERITQVAPALARISQTHRKAPASGSC